MIIKNYEAMETANNLEAIIKANYILPGIVGYGISRNLRKIKNELKEYTDARNEAIRKYGKENDGVYSIESPESVLKFKEDMKELDSVEIDIDIFKVSIDEFKSDYPAMVMSALDFMIE